MKVDGGQPWMLTSEQTAEVLVLVDSLRTPAAKEKLAALVKLGLPPREFFARLKALAQTQGV